MAWIYWVLFLAFLALAVIFLMGLGEEKDNEE